MIHGTAGLVREAVKKLEKAATEFSNLSDSERQEKYWPLTLQVHLALTELYLKQHRFYEAKEILEVLGSFNLGNALEDQRSIPDSGITMRLLNTCYQKANAWEEKKAKAELLLRKAHAAYGSYLETGSFYCKVGDLGRAEQAYLNALKEASNLIMENHADSTLFSLHTIRFLGACYGLAQTYLMTERSSDVVAVLDLGKQKIEQLDRFDLKEPLEEFCVLFVDLYMSMGEQERAMSICQHLLPIMPHSISLKKKIRVLTQKERGQLLEARS
jgi:tetratricopeptide (TPR) repeat protein